MTEESKSATEVQEEVDEEVSEEEVSLNVEEKERVNVPVWAGLGAIATGVIMLLASMAAGYLIVDYGYWSTFALSGATRAASALILLGVFGLSAVAPSHPEPPARTASNARTATD